MMDIDPYESINQYNPYESIREETADELLLIENESLTERVAELEKIVSQQQAELSLFYGFSQSSASGSPLRKWMSHQDVKGTNNISSQSIADRLSRRTTPSLQSINQNPSSYTVSRSSSCNNRQPIFNSSTHTLQLQISGRSVNVPVPTEIENFDPATEQSAPNTPPPRLEWAYGYRGKDVRNNVHYLPTGELVYFCGSVVVLYNVGEHTQRHYTEHTSDVKCITVHPNRVIVASAQSTCHQRERRSEFELCDPILSSKDIENSLDTVHTVGRNKPKTVLAICFTKTGDVLTGDSNGTLSLWDPISFRAKKQAHTVHPGGIMALCVNRNENVLSAGKDRVIIEWETTDLVRRRKPTELPDDYGFPRVIINTERNTVIIGTSRNVLLVGGFEMDFIEIVNADFENVTCCVAVQPYSFITASADGEIRLHNTSSKTLEWRKNYGKGVTCITVNPTGSLLALGTCSGTWWLMDLSTKNLNFEQKESTQPITAIQFSPSGSSTGEFMDNAIIQDVKWATCNCRISFEVGCIAHSVEGITTICRSPSEDKVVIGRDNGSVRVYTYPVTSTSAGFHALSGHCHAVSSTVFTELNLITIGLVDNTIHQWKLQ
ncbi:HELP domain protein [Dictyocaulus viviparus]|uniref:HELP domain protein n=1 Tax=Dictyocaulus viviparus TaxID=29172 RepID=A0A0D8Y8I2_DICVI|nr:HELP domain protein [Dictyocaulus viviparus]